MTVTDIRPSVIQNIPLPRSTPAPPSDGLSVLDTTEVRWFFPGPIPADVGALFSGSTAVREQRCDTYLLDGRDDVGVKRRSGDVLEVKVRQSDEGPVRLADGLDGRLEVWRKWSPVEGLVDDEAARRWGDVCKSIVKRRFSIDGTEIRCSPVHNAVSAGCDIEVAEITVGGTQSWTLGFEAFGPQPTRRRSLLVAWPGLMVAAEHPVSLRLSGDGSMGYPEWLLHHQLAAQVVGAPA